MTTHDLDRLFTFHPASPSQAIRYGELRAGGHALASQILDLCPPSAEQTLAIRHIQQAVMFANAAIACNED